MQGGPILLILSVPWVVYGAALVRYQKWCYVGGIVLFSVGALASLYYGAWVRLFLNVLFLVAIAMPASKGLLYRRTVRTTR